MNTWTPPSSRSHELAMGHRRLQGQTAPHSDLLTPPSSRSHVLAVGDRHLQDQTAPHSDLLTYSRSLRAHKAVGSTLTTTQKNIHIGSGTLICLRGRFQDPSYH